MIEAPAPEKGNTRAGPRRIVGLVIGYMSNPFYTDALEVFSREFQRKGYQPLVMVLPDGMDEAGSERIVNQMLSYQIDGLILASTVVDDRLAARCRAADLPVVLFNRHVADSGLSQVTSANRQGAAKIGRFLVTAGHRRIGHVAGWYGSSSARDRREGFLEGLAELGQDCVGIEGGRYTHADAVRATDLLLEQRVDALFVLNDHMAFAVMDHLRSVRGLSIPDDISVVGYDDVPMAAFAAYNLTTVRLPVNRMVKAAVKTLVNQIEAKSSEVEWIEIDGPLIQRGSARTA